VPILNQWDRVGFKQIQSRRVRMLVHFEQISDGVGNVTTQLDVTVTQVQKRSWLFWWKDITAYDLTVKGAFSGPRSPLNTSLPGGSGYVQNGNPFAKSGVALNSKVIHFLDVSPATTPLYSIDNAEYSTVATFSPTWSDQVIATVKW
jgi:hypothetical protein